LKKSVNTSEFDKDNGSYLRLSLGEFFAERSGALGCLGGSNSVKRVSMNYARSDENHGCLGPFYVAVTKYLSLGRL
jgi:hypothetical protein